MFDFWPVLSFIGSVGKVVVRPQGGLKAVVWTDALQGVIYVVGLCLVLGIVSAMWSRILVFCLSIGGDHTAKFVCFVLQLKSSEEMFMQCEGPFACFRLGRAQSRRIRKGFWSRSQPRQAWCVEVSSPFHAKFVSRLHETFSFIQVRNLTKKPHSVLLDFCLNCCANADINTFLLFKPFAFPFPVSIRTLTETE